MSTQTTSVTGPVVAPPATVPPLRNGDRLSWPEFHRRYSAMPEVKKAELIDGVVYMPSPVSDDHGTPHFDLITSLGLYRWATPGVAGSDNGTLRLDLDSTPQPDVFLRLLESHGGQSRLGEDRYIHGAPELVAEVAASTVSLALHAKLNTYRRHGVREYVVWRVEDRAIDWYILREGRFDPLPLTPDGLYRSEIFPGLWLDPTALVNGNFSRVAQVAQQGIASPEHAAFVAKLQQAAANRQS